MKKLSARLIAAIILGIILLISASVFISQMIDHKQADSSYAEAQNLVQLPDLETIPETPADTMPEVPDTQELPPSDEETEEPVAEEPIYVSPYAEAFRTMDFASLREVNSDVLGWILIPSTKLSYPLMQGDDNSYYLNHTWNQSRSSAGAIFMEQYNNSNLSDFNTIIYGHRMVNGSMFASLKYYKNKSYWQAHPSVYIINDSGTYTYQIFSAYEIGTSEDTYRLSFPDDETKQAYIDFCLEQSVIDTGIIPTIDNQILTLSTCTGRGHETRWVVQAVLQTISTT